MKLQSIQIMRGFAVLMVVQHHTYWAITTGQGNPPAIDIFGRTGAIGVDLFFVISGFIMNFTITKSNSFGFEKALEFISKRVWRIFPPYLFWTTIILALWSQGLILRNHNWTLDQIISSYTLWPYYEKETFSINHPILDQGWSLSFECYFYVITGLTLAVTKPTLLKIAGSFAIMGLVSTIIVEKNVSNYLFRSPLIFEFLLGWTSYSLSSCRFFENITLSKISPNFLFIVTIVLFVFIASITSHFSENILLRSICWGGASFLLVYAVSITPIRTENIISKVMLATGNASYSIYLIHGLFTIALTFLAKKGLTIAFNPYALTFALVPVISSLSAIGYVLIEKPLARFSPNNIVSIIPRKN